MTHTDRYRYDPHTTALDQRRAEWRAVDIQLAEPWTDPDHPLYVDAPAAPVPTSHRAQRTFTDTELTEWAQNIVRQANR